MSKHESKFKLKGHISLLVHLLLNRRRELCAAFEPAPRRNAVDSFFA